MTNIPRFDQSFWYSGFDGYLFAELLPAQPNYWFVSILNGKYFVSSNISISDRAVLPFLQSHKFRFLQATWQYEKSNSFSKNPFLVLAPPKQVISICQSGIQPLPQSSQSSSIKIFKKNQLTKSNSAYIYFVVTEDHQFLKIGFSKNPCSRFAELQASQPQGLIYLGSFATNRERFEDICQRFEHLLVRNGWFKYTLELQENIEISLS